MMTREEAIALLNEQYETCKRIYDCSADQRKSYPNVPQFMEALGMALTALRPVSREQVRRGTIIETIKDGRMNRVFSCCNRDFTELTCWYVPDFCPACGAPMTEEAVQILIERMEELKNES